MPKSVSQAVAEVVQSAGEPLTVAEMLQRVGADVALSVRKPEATVSSALFENPLIATLGGRPARYVWWPARLLGCYFRQPLARMNPDTGELPLTDEVWIALWPDFYGSRLGPRQVKIELAGGPTLVTTVEHLRPHKPVWGLAGEPALLEWCRASGLGPGDDLTLHVVDLDERRYAFSPARSAERDQAALSESEDRLRDAALDVARSSRQELLLHHDLAPRLIGRGVYRAPVPPRPLAEVLRADLRFVVTGHDSVALTARLVERAEAEWAETAGAENLDRPAGDPYSPRDESERRAWGEYLFDHGMEYRWAHDDMMAEAYYRAALTADPGHADAWVHIGNTRFDEGLLDEALGNYLRAEAAALARTIGNPATYRGVFWGDVDSRPYMRALHGKGLTLWRLGRLKEAAAVFRQQLRLNPNDNQGVRFLLPHLKEGLSWEESEARLEATGLFG